ncbi:MAG: oligosaccharide repeat unit polymerase [Cyanobacteria bacterium]|nr:oligosaccharide repeat unit polymerase [Cyanobacteriota bacterium]
MEEYSLLEKLVAIMLSGLILAQAAVIKRHVGTWLFPACLFGLFWFVFTIVPLILLFFVPLDPRPLAYILACALMFSAGGLFFGWKRAFELNAQIRAERITRFNTRFIRNMFYLTSAIALGCVMLNSLAQGFAIDDVVTDVIGSAAQYATRRGTGELRVNIFGQMSLVFIYLAASLGGLLLSEAQTRAQRAAWLIIALSPSTIVMVTQSAKGALFLALSLIYGGILLGWLQQGRLKIAERKALIPAILCTSILLTLVAVSFFSRGLQGTTDFSFQGLVEGLRPYFASYLFGHMYAFADWFSYISGAPSSFSYFVPESTRGLYTFFALFRFFDSGQQLPDGVFQEVYTNGDLIVTNIYTFFRPVITDFGLIGCLIFMFLIGVIYHWCFHSLLATKRPAFSAAMFVMMVGFIVQSYLGSLLMYNSFYACLILLSTVIFINNLQQRRRAVESRAKAHGNWRMAEGPAVPRQTWGRRTTS